MRCGNKSALLTKTQPTQEEEEKRKAELALARKKEFAHRFKNRGKRHSPSPDTSDAVTTTDEQENPAKKPKRGSTPPLTNYQKEVHSLDSRILKDTGTGVRPFVK